ncbi:unnamed protein product, partial [Ectocarpus sp. 6 AP-2014]
MEKNSRCSSPSFFAEQTFRLHSKRFYAKADTCCDLLICDEAHRLKNAETATNQNLLFRAIEAKYKFDGVSPKQSMLFFLCSVSPTEVVAMALSALKCRKRVLLSGTPMQNDLEEFYAMTDFTNPGV